MGSSIRKVYLTKIYTGKDETQSPIINFQESDFLVWKGNEETMAKRMKRLP